MADFDVAIMGAGPGGYVAAIRAAQLGLKTAVIEREHLGGVCLNWGCIPTKALLRSAEVLHLAQHGHDFGLEIKNPSYNMEAIIERSRRVAQQLSGGIAHLLKKNKVSHLSGEAIFQDKQTLKINDKVVTANNIIVATGARARSLPMIPFDGEYVLSYREAMIQKTVPSNLIIIGSGAIGIEFASFYNTLGANVTVIEAAGRILLSEDSEIAALAQKSLEKKGIKFILNAKVQSFEKKKKDAVLSVEVNGATQNLSCQKVIMAIGVVANIDNIGLEKAGIKIENGHIVTDGYGQTNIANIFAIGDVASAPWLAHKASHEAVIAVEKIAGKNPHPLDSNNIPGCIYAHPQIASVGFTEEQAKQKGYKVKVGRFPFLANGKAIAMGDTEGMIKTIFDEKTGQLLGAHLCGIEVTEMIQGFALARKLETTEKEIMETIFPHPTLSEMMHESVLNAFGKAIHI